MGNGSTTWLARVRDRALGLLFPPACVVCSTDLEEDEDWDDILLCDACRAALPRFAWATCGRCLARVPEIPGPTPDCKHCRDHRLQFDRAVALGPYEGLIRDLVLEMKEDATGRLALVLAKLLAHERAAEFRTAAPDAVVPIPMHGWRRFSRRADSAVALATALGRHLNVRVEPRLLHWRHDASAQVGLSQRGRFRNMQGVLQVRTGFRLDAPRIVLVDDIITTGATCSEAARALKRAGAAEVTVALIGRTTAI